ncbi:MAG: GntR family transcriptional regulator [Gammaproteobacteria bacterium]|nr:GntR family transcriptional regulator [Gammaproteobacteria bacterium]
MVLSGALSTNQKLPPTRELTRKLGISRIMVKSVCITRFRRLYAGQDGFWSFHFRRYMF